MKGITETIFRDNDGKIHPNRQDAARSNLMKAIFAVEKSKLYAAKIPAKEDANGERNFMALLMEITERAAIEHWITTNLETLERLIASYVDDMTDHDKALSA